MQEKFVWRRTGAVCSAALVALVLIAPSRLEAQRGAPAGPPPTAQQFAPVDVTGVWETIVNEDWRWRMVTPAKGDYQSVTLNAAARKVADSWDPDRDTAAGMQCKAYGAAAVMRHPGRIRISWQDPNTLKIETEAGTQTRLLHFAPTQPAASEADTWQGQSVAQWQLPQVVGGRNAGERKGTTIKVTTTKLRPGYLRKNGIPYSANASVIEYFNVLTGPNSDPLLLVSNFVYDDQYLTQPFATSTHYRKLGAGAPWTPEPCTAK
jgi:hypothetical protein